MIKYRKGNILDVQSGYIVHGCNAKGVMGAGVAKAIATLYPEILKPYRDYCKALAENSLGKAVCVRVTDELTIVNAITQLTYGNYPSTRYVSYDAIDTVFTDIAYMLNPEADFVHIPKIGAGLGGGDWVVIASIINHRMKDYNVICWEL